MNIKKLLDSRTYISSIDDSASMFIIKFDCIPQLMFGLILSSINYSDRDFQAISLKSSLSVSIL